MKGDALRINGPATLAGDVYVGGFKHLLVGAVAAALLGREAVSLRNCPDILELSVLSDLLAALGGTVTRRDSRLDLEFDRLHDGSLDPDLCRSIHGAVYLVPGLLSRFGAARLPLTGGCRIGAAPQGERPVGHYVEVLERFGAKARLLNHVLEVTCHRMRGCTIDMRDFTTDPKVLTGPLYSGATKYAILCAIAAQGTSRIRHPYPKLDVVELVELMRRMGGEVHYESDDAIVVEGRGSDALDQRAVYELPADLIELVTWIAVAATTDSDLRVHGAEMSRALDGLTAERAVWHRMGISVDCVGNVLTVNRAARLSATSITAASHDIYSDSQPFFTLLATHASGESVVRDRVWAGRFRFVDGLQRMGAHITRCEDTMVVTGPCVPYKPEQHIVATDLRAAAVLVTAALGVSGRTTIAGCSHLRRGYADLPGVLRRLGADIEIEIVAEVHQ
jgi:UDP-N-acetylglucosamine 1-carboxyvinyltransferase